MFGLLLAVAYLSFISLGLPDAILGSAWPSMYPELGVPVSWMGAISLTITVGTIVSSLLSDRINRWLGTGKTTAVSVALTAAALLGFSACTSYWQLCIWAIPYGLGAGSVDAALNNYAALHFKARHMSWLHFFWGVGATIGPYVTGWCLAHGRSWNSGYRYIGLLQVVLVVILAAAVPLWKESKERENEGEKPGKSLKEVMRMGGAKEILLAFLCYCAVEQTAGPWASSWLVLSRGFDPETAANWAALFYLGITGGRFLCGFIADAIGDRRMIRLGQCIIFAGILLLLFPLQAAAFAGLMLIGVGCAPIYPSVIHSVPTLFGRENSQVMVGVQMACAYTGVMVAPPVFGLLAQFISAALFPGYLLLFAALMTVLTELVYHRTGHPPRSTP